MNASYPAQAIIWKDFRHSEAFLQDTALIS
jgi:hypothetical protein